MQVVHLSGRIDWPEVEAFRAKLAPELAARYRAYPYLHAEMGAAYSAADLVVSRAGASVLGELPLFGLPALLVPYPYAWRYQKTNADYLARRGAAVVIPEPELPARLLPVVQELLQNSQRLEQMRQAMQSLRRPDAAMRIAGLVLEQAKDGAR
jgi:UDP-N-acetylglucosamine--N-acetylmuramyl-(pentapeptide) pyrophosphoryl-undecaprenol N-acetylglucosamine transferase